MTILDHVIPAVLLPVFGNVLQEKIAFLRYGPGVRSRGFPWFCAEVTVWDQGMQSFCDAILFVRRPFSNRCPECNCFLESSSQAVADISRATGRKRRAVGAGRVRMRGADLLA
jgi:hypothetical protein